MGPIDRGRRWLAALALAACASLSHAAPPGPFALDGQAYAFDNPQAVTGTGSQLDYPAFCVDPKGTGRESVLTGAGPAVWRTITLDPVEQAFYVEGSGQVPYPVVVAEPLGFTQGNPLLVAPIDASGAPKVYAEMIVDFESSHPVGIFDLATATLEHVALTYGLPAALIDVNGDGLPEAIVLNDLRSQISVISVMDAQLTHELYQAPITFAYWNAFAVGRFDSTAQAEIVTSAGLVYGLGASGMTQVGSIPATVNGQTISLLAAGDVDGDGIDEIIAVYGAATIVAYKFSPQKVLWQTTPSADSTDLILSLRIIDLTGSGHPQVVAGQQGDNTAVQLGYIYILDGATGAQQLAFPHPDSGLFAFNACDVDGTGVRSIVVSQDVPVTGPSRFYVYDSQTGEQKWRSNEEIGPVEGVVVADVEGTGAPDVVFMPNGVVGVGDLALHARDAASFVRRWDTPSPFLPVLGTDALTALAAGNAVGDGHTDLVAGSSQNGVGIIWIVDGPTHTLKSTIQLDSGDIVEAVALADLDATGTLDIVAGVQGPAGPRLEVINGSTGTRLWHVAIGTEQLSVLKLKVADLNLDGHDDVMVHMNTDNEGGPEVYLLDGATHAIRSLPITGVNAFESIVISGRADLGLAVAHGDGTIELLDSTSGATLGRNTACSLQINALSRDNLSSAGPEEVLYSCGQQVGWMALQTGAKQMLTANAGDWLGLSDNLFSFGTNPSTDRIIVNSNIGIAHLSPTARLAPYVNPVNAVSTNTYGTHWTMPAGGSITSGTFDGTASTLTVISQPAHGTLTLAGGGFSYQPNGPYEGSDFFTLQASTGEATSAPTTFLMVLRNSAPFMNPPTASLTVAPGNTASVTIPAEDSDDDTLTYQIVQAPTKGTVQLNGNLATYAAGVGSSGTDTFSVRAFDQLDYSDPLLVTVTIAAAQPPPPPPPPSNPPPASGGGGGLDPATLGVLLLWAWTCLKRRDRRAVPADRVITP